MPIGLETRPPVAIPGPTGRRPWSTQLLREWASVKYPGVTLTEQVRLGPTEEHVVGVPIPAAWARALSVWNWYADGLIVLPDQVLVIEAKVHPEPGAIGQVLFYRRLMNSSPGLIDLMARSFVPVVLFAEEDKEVTQFANSLGVRVETYTPSWIVDYLQQVQFRRRTVAS